MDRQNTGLFDRPFTLGFGASLRDDLSGSGLRLRNAVGGLLLSKFEDPLNSGAQALQ
jgi:hypothetical protein